HETNSHEDACTGHWLSPVCSHAHSAIVPQTLPELRQECRAVASCIGDLAIPQQLLRRMTSRKTEWALDLAADARKILWSRRLQTCPLLRRCPLADDDERHPLTRMHLSEVATLKQFLHRQSHCLGAPDFGVRFQFGKGTRS